MKTFTLILLALFMSITTSVAQWNADPAMGTRVRPNIPTYYEPIIVPSDSGRVFVIWGESDTLAVPPFPIPQPVTALRFQRVSPNGNLDFGSQGKDVVVYTNQLLAGRARAIPWKDGGIVISWGELFSQAILALNRNGDTVWTYTGSLHGMEAVNSPCYLVPDGRNGLFIVPEVHGTNWGEHQQTRVFRMDSTGNMVWSGFAVADSASPSCVKGDGKGNVYIGTESEQRGVFLNKVDSSMNLLWGTPSRFDTNNLYTPIYNETMQILEDGSGGAFTTWIDGPGDCVLAHISADGVWSSGATGWSVGPAHVGYTGHRTSMISNGSARAIVAWESAGDSILVQCFDTTGAPLWNSGTPTFIDTASVVIAVVRNTSQTVIVFYSQSNGSDEDIFARMLSNDGQLLWNGDRKPISTAPGDQMAQSYGDIAAPHLDDGAFLAWKDYRNGGIDIYCTAIDGDGNNLPVELLSFSASLVESNVLLTWRTASETNNAGFRVQRSLDGSAWESIGYVSGAGTSIQTGEYSYLDPIDNLYSDGAYYRLRQEDFDGTHEYSPLQYVAFGSQPSSVALHGVYPNPASGQIQIGFTLDADYSVALGIYNMLGAKVREIPTGTMSSGSHLIPAEISGLPEGMYVIRMATPAGVQAVKMRVGE